MLQKAPFVKEGTVAGRQRSMGIIALYLVLIAGAELTTTYDARYGIVFHAGVLFALLIHAAVLHKTDRAFAGLLSALVVAPLIRILSISMPLLQFNFVTWFQLTSIPVFITLFVLIYLHDISARDIALNLPEAKHVPLELVVIVVAVPIGIMEYQILKPGILVPLSLEALIVPAVILLVCTGFLEELAFRGLMQYHALRTLGFSGIIMISLLFGALHIGNLTVLDVLLASGIGFLYALVVQITRSLYGVSISHGIINIMLFLIAPNLL